MRKTNHPHRLIVPDITCELQWAQNQEADYRQIINLYKKESDYCKKNLITVKEADYCKKKLITEKNTLKEADY